MSSILRAAALSAALLLCSTALLAQGDAPTATADDWPALIEERDAKLSRLNEIRQELQAADEQQATELQTEGSQLLEGIFADLFPRMRSAAFDLLKRDTVDEDTLNAIAELAYRTFQENKFAEAGALADNVLEKSPENAIAVNVAGVCAFAIQDFEKSAKLLNEAAEKSLLIPSLGERYVESATKYVDYWKEEQVIREQEAGAAAAQRLPQVEFNTSRGKILVELFENEAPNTVANFINLVEMGFYDGTQFHRVIPGFMAQGEIPIRNPEQKARRGPADQVTSSRASGIRKTLGGTLRALSAWPTRERTPVVRSSS